MIFLVVNIPIHLSKSIWIVLEAIAGLIFLYLAFYYHQGDISL